MRRQTGADPDDWDQVDWILSQTAAPAKLGGRGESVNQSQELCWPQRGIRVVNDEEKCAITVRTSGLQRRPSPIMEGCRVKQHSGRQSNGKASEALG